MFLKIKFIGKRIAVQAQALYDTPLIHKIVNYGRTKMSSDEIDVINQGGSSNLGRIQNIQIKTELVIVETVYVVTAFVNNNQLKSLTQKIQHPHLDDIIDELAIMTPF
ncbi:hypothetical protein pb186bvf_013335 [Paramecium bursaria]